MLKGSIENSRGIPGSRATHVIIMYVLRRCSAEEQRRAGGRGRGWAAAGGFPIDDEIYRCQSSQAPPAPAAAAAALAQQSQHRQVQVGGNEQSLARSVTLLQSVQAGAAGVVHLSLLPPFPLFVL